MKMLSKHLLKHTTTTHCHSQDPHVKGALKGKECGEGCPLFPLEKMSGEKLCPLLRKFFNFYEYMGAFGHCSKENYW